MKDKKALITALMIGILFFLMTACSSSNEPPTATPTIEIPPTATPTSTPTLTPTAIPTATPTIQPTAAVLSEEMSNWWVEYAPNIAEYTNGLTDLVNWILKKDEKYESMSTAEIEDFVKLTVGSLVDNISILNLSNCPDIEFQQALDGLYEETLEMSYNFNTAFETNDVDSYEKAFHNVQNAINLYKVVADKIQEALGE